MPFNYKVVKAAGTGNANATLSDSAIGAPCTRVEIHNEGSADLTIEIGGITITVAGTTAYDGDFEVFTSMDIVATGDYNWVTKE